MKEIILWSLRILTILVAIPLVLSVLQYVTYCQQPTIFQLFSQNTSYQNFTDVMQKVMCNPIEIMLLKILALFGGLVIAMVLVNKYLR